MSKSKKNGKKKRVWIAAVALSIAIAGGGYYYTNSASEVQAQETPAVQTSVVREGDLVLSTTGAGELIASDQVELSFANSGELVEVSVGVGDEVEEGQVLAQVDDLAARESVASAETQLAKAQSDLEATLVAYEELFEGASDADILDAKASIKTAIEAFEELQAGATTAEIIEAEAALAAAQEDYETLVNGLDTDEIRELEIAVESAQNSLWSAQMNRDASGTDQGIASGSYDQAQANVYNAELSVEKAQLALEEAMEPATEAELLDAEARVASAQETLDELIAGASEAELATAKASIARLEEALEDLVADPDESDVDAAEAAIAEAELSLSQILLALESAEQDLADTSLTAPTSGTVTEVDAEAGERVSSETTVVTIADLGSLLIEVYVDESDTDMLAVGNEVTVEFDALPDVLLTGHVVQVDPTLSTVENTTVVIGLVALDEGQEELTDSLLIGSTATVDVIAANAENAVLVPVESLVELGPDEYAVFVMEDGEPRLRTVEVGIQDYTYAEIISGLELGELVTTGIVEVN